MTMMSADVRNVLALVVASLIVYHVMKFLRDAVWEPLRLRRVMAKQGVSGSPFRFLVGHIMEMVKFSQSFPDNLPMHDYANLSPTVTPQYPLFLPKYSKMFLYWWGTKTHLVVRDPEIVKELSITNHDSLARSELAWKYLFQLMGDGLLSVEGEKWTTERRTLRPFFHQDALKAMVEAMVKGAATEIQTWEQRLPMEGARRKSTCS